ncbi:hypothetical protein E4U52_005851 [Claviceps spartinae]|nr:hypothetical protein E4U52_005851 [Claviceps spartinae]
MSLASSPSGGEEGRTSFKNGNLRSYREATPHAGSRSANLNLSLNTLRLSESFDTIKLDVGLLAWHAGHFPTENDAQIPEKVSEDDLYAILELSQNICINVERIMSLRNQRQGRADTSSNVDGAFSPSLENHQYRSIRSDISRQQTCESGPNLRIPAKRSRGPSCCACSTEQEGQSSGKALEEATFFMLIHMHWERLTVDAVSRDVCVDVGVHVLRRCTEARDSSRESFFADDGHASTADIHVKWKFSHDVDREIIKNGPWPQRNHTFVDGRDEA